MGEPAAAWEPLYQRCPRCDGTGARIIARRSWRRRWTWGRCPACRGARWMLSARGRDMFARLEDMRP